MIRPMTKRQHISARGLDQGMTLILRRRIMPMTLGLMLGFPLSHFAALGQASASDRVGSLLERSPQDDWPILQPSDEGDAVHELQTALERLGIYDGPADRRYSDRTQAAVETFQQQEGLAVDGLAGPETWQRLALRLLPQEVFRQIPVLTTDSLSFTVLAVAQPAPPPSPWWLVLMPAIPLVGGAFTYLQHRSQKLRP